MKAESLEEKVASIPSDWAFKTCRELGVPVRGGSPRPAGDPRYFNGSYIPWLTVAALTNIPASQLEVRETESCLTEEGSRHSRTLDPGTLIIANSGATLGVSKILGIKCCANDGIAALLNFSKDVYPPYVAHYINTKTQYLRDVVATGNGQPNLNTQLIGDFKILLPSTRKEQESIANALSDVDALIESLEKLIEKKRLIKQGAMRELLRPDKTWKSTNLFELCDGKKELFDDGDWIEAEHITNEGVRLIQTGNVGVGIFIDRDEKKYIFEESFSKLKCKLIRAGDLLVCRLADPAGRACILPELDESKVITSVDVTICRPSLQKADRRFLVQMFSTGGWLRSIAERSGGTTHKRIARGALSKIEIKVPEISTQSEIADILASMDDEVISLETKLTKTRLLKQGMMQELLTGRIRLI